MEREKRKVRNARHNPSIVRRERIYESVVGASKSFLAYSVLDDAPNKSTDAKRKAGNAWRGRKSIDNTRAWEEFSERKMRERVEFALVVDMPSGCRGTRF